MTAEVAKIQNPRYTRGLRFVPQGEGGYDECWYPICLSTEIKRGEIKGFDFLDGKVIVYRKEDGEVCVMSAYCRHLGVDLSLGKLVDNNIQCPYHQWEYDPTGQCVKTAVGDTPPSRARLFKFPVAEHLGLIWIYNGETPAYDVPTFPIDIDELETYVCRAIEVPMDAFMLYSNTMDLQHLVSLHQGRFTGYPEEFDIQKHSISYTQKIVFPVLGESEQTITLFGTNCITIYFEMNGRKTFMMSPGLVTKGPVTKTFSITATTKAGSKLAIDPGKTSIFEKLAIKFHLRKVDFFGKKLNAEDYEIFKTISPRLDTFSASDKALKIFFDYARNYPRSNVASDLICNDYKKAARQT